jgi:hypothetical protein
MKSTVYFRVSIAYSIHTEDIVADAFPTFEKIALVKIMLLYLW